MTTPKLTIDGHVQNQLVLTFSELAEFEESERVVDVSRFHPTRNGDGVTLESLLSRVIPTSQASYLTLHATADDFAASVPLEPIRNEGILVYSVDGQPMTLEQGGPFRFLIRDPAACHTDELDDCANVKFVDRIELTDGPGRDTRPTDDQEHEELHRSQDENPAES
jgi:2-dehydropantoate 2-reductase